MSEKRIIFVTGTRADFGKLKPLMEKVEENEDTECFIFATGMHTLARYGSTFLEILKCGFTNFFPFMNQMESNSSDMDIVLSETIRGLAHYIREVKPDLIIVHGDRVEAMAGAIVGSFNNIRVAHVEGGELSGTIDELIRHSVSKLSHIHFVANDDAKRRLMQMGEKPDSIYVIGSPDVDIMLSDTLPNIEVVKEKYEIEFEDYSILIYHPVTTELDRLRSNVESLVSAVVESGKNYIVIYPNNDNGSDIILEAYNKFEGNVQFKQFPSLRFEYFLTLLKHADMIVGNSSTGIHEAPVYGVPSINIGSRQNNRSKDKDIIHVNGAHEELLHAISSINGHREVSLDFGRGESAKMFASVLKKGSIWDISVQKTFQDLC